MSVIILGGCGEIGKYIAKDLVESGFKVTITDIREREGKLLAKKLGSRATSSKLDIRQLDVLIEVLKGYKIVINNIGPYFKFGDWIPRAAIKAGINYIDICDDHDVTFNLLNLHKYVEKENLTFLINFGASPGLKPGKFYKMKNVLRLFRL
ncbi:MAG: SDR family NAD(P)-dependent oxidoreductase [Promethearchaeia archaeon]